MIRCALALLALPAAAAFGDWQSQVTPPTPGDFPLPRPMHATYRCGWAALSAGEIQVDFSHAPGVAELEAKGGTTGFVRTLWSMDATHRARANSATLLPISMNQLEIYHGKTLRTELSFTADGVTRFRESKPADPTPAKRRRFDYPNLYDLHSALLFLRSQRLKDNEVLNIVVYPASTPYLATVRVLEHDRVQVKCGRYPAIKLELGLQRITRDFKLEPHQKFKRAFAWLSDDGDRLLLKVQASIFVGSAWAELNSVKFAGRTP